MVCICPKRYPKYAVKKLHARIFGHYLILRRLRSNTYLIYLSSNMSISSIFNVTDLFSYRGTFEYPVSPSSVSEGTSSTLIPRALSTAL